MMISEFIDRTGFEPTAKEFEKIEEAYYGFDGDKDAFCTAFVKGDGGKRICKARALEIEQLKSTLMEIEKQYKKEIEDREIRISKLSADLDRELGWKPCFDAGTNMEQSRYESLARSGKEMTDEEAKKFIAEECGFSQDKVTVLHEVNTFEVNKHGQLRKSGTFARIPVYEATDWNYVRFNCAGFMYEIVNGNLCFYSR